MPCQLCSMPLFTRFVLTAVSLRHVCAAAHRATHMTWLHCRGGRCGAVRFSSPCGQPRQCQCAAVAAAAAAAAAPPSCMSSRCRCRTQTPADAERNYLERAKNLDMYGLDLYPAQIRVRSKATNQYCIRQHSIGSVT